MKRRILALAVLIMVAASAFLLIGCANKMLYGSWKLVQSADADTGEFKDYDFMFPIVLEIKSDGTVWMLGSLFGTYEKEGREYKFWYDNDGEKGELLTGGWEMIGAELFIYPDDIPVIYKFSRLTDPTPAP